MSNPTAKELKKSIEEITAYRDRIQNEVETIAKKLRIPQNKIETSLNSHEELSHLEVILQQLKEQLSEA